MDRTKIGIALVLGAGGPAAWVFHAAALGALNELTGWDARDADIAIGTSAGSTVAAALRAGASPSDIAAAIARPPTADQRAEVEAEMRAARARRTPVNPSLTRHLLYGGSGIGVAVSGLLPTGRYPTWPLTRYRADLPLPDAWDGSLWIPAVRATDGRLVVFGRDHRSAGVAEAIEASSSLPGIFRPKHIEGVPYVDGGASSPTHADLALSGPHDAVVVSSPMTRPSRAPTSGYARFRLSAELRMLRRRRMPALVVAPLRDADRLFRRFPRRDPHLRTEIETAARQATEKALESSPGMAAMLAAAASGRHGHSQGFLMKDS